MGGRGGREGREGGQVEGEERGQKMKGRRKAREGGGEREKMEEKGGGTKGVWGVKGKRGKVCEKARRNLNGGGVRGWKNAKKEEG